MRQRLGLAAAMLRRPRLLILDEPTNGMDPAGIRDLRAALRRLARDGVTVMLSSHNMAQVEEICDSVTVLHHGRVVFAGGLDAMRADAPDPVWRMRTSDDDAALERAGTGRAGSRPSGRDGGLVVFAAQDRLDAYVLGLGRAGVAVRGLELDVTPLESLFFQLTGEPGRGSPGGPSLRARPAAPRARPPGGPVTLAAGQWPAFAGSAVGRRDGVRASWRCGGWSWPSSASQLAGAGDPRSSA